MRVKFCPSCGTPVHGAIRFCSRCGENLELLYALGRESRSADEFKRDLKSFIESFIENNAELIKELAAKVERGEAVEKGIFFSVEMRGGKPVIKAGDLKDLEKLIKGTPLYPALQEMFSKHSAGGVEFMEARPRISEEADRKLIELQLPGVSSLKDVAFNRIPGGLELIAKAERRIYFSKVELPEDAEISRSTLEEGLLRIEVRESG